jgi:hypothetical protein
MLKFFRKYQKVFFAFIAFIIVVTFSFFGTQSIATKITKPKDIDVSTAYDGSKVKLSDIENMSLFLSTDYSDSSLTYSHFRPNLFNDGVLRNDILRSGLAKIFFEKYFDQLKVSFESKFEKIQKYKPFVHIEDPSISFEVVMQMLNPKVMILLKEIQMQKELNLEFFDKYLELYNEQAKFQPDLIKKILLYHEKQNDIPPDIRLHQDSISLFGFDTTIDWFGKDFIDLVSQFIINTALVAQEKGYEVTTQEALSELMINLKRALNNQVKEPITSYFKKMLYQLRMDEKIAANIWRQVLLFRKYFKDVSNNTLVDDLAYREFLDYSATIAKIKLYHLPEYLKIKNFEDLMRFDMYLMATTKKSDPLEIPKEFLSIEEIEKKYPELFEKKYSVNVRHTNLEKASVKVKVKDMYFWQLQDENWQKLKNKFSFLILAKTKKEKLDVINALDFNQKSQLDTFSRQEMVKENPALINEALLAENEKKYDFYIFKNCKLPVSIKDIDKIEKYLDSQDKIEKYTEDNNNFFAIEIIQKPNGKNLISFEKALKNKIIDKMLNKYLIDQYLILRETYPQKFKDENDEFKPFDLIRDEIAQIVFQDVLTKLKLLNITQDKSLDGLSIYRLYLFVEDIFQNIISNENYLQNLNSQFNVVCEDLEISRSKRPTWLEKTAFSLKEKKYSSIDMSEKGNMQFLFLESFKKPKVSSDKINIAKEAFFTEISMLLTKKLIKAFIEKECIILPVENDV